jgi:hypothetical protein
MHAASRHAAQVAQQDVPLPLATQFAIALLIASIAGYLFWDLWSRRAERRQ